MPLRTNGTYVLTGQTPAIFNQDYENYGKFRDALFKISENAPVFQRELLKKVTASDLKPHFDGFTSVAIGYGLDLLVRKNDEVDTYLKEAGLSALNDADEKTLDNARQLRKDYLAFDLDKVNDGQAERIEKANEYLDQLKDTINSSGGLVEFPADATTGKKLERLMEHYVDSGHPDRFLAHAGRRLGLRHRSRRCHRCPRR